MSKVKRVVIIIMGLLSAMSMVFVSPLSAFALGKFNADFYSANNIVIYNPDDTGCGNGTNSVTTLTGANNEEKIYNYWTSLGFSPAQAAGITGSLQAESGFSPFRQEVLPHKTVAESWPDGGYGIAQFTTSRAAITQSLSTSFSDLFTQYYKPDYGGAVTAATGFVPAGVPTDVNDKFLKVELDFLWTTIQGLTPNPTYKVRSDGLAADFGLTIASKQKLADYLKTLTDAGQVAEAWTYLYESPSDVKNTATVRAGLATAVLSQYGNGNTSDSAACGSIGTGGLDYDAAVTFGKYYYAHRWDLFGSPGRSPSGGFAWNNVGQSNQCTALVYYVNTEFITKGTGSGNGKDVVSILLKSHANFYQSADKTSIQPFTIFSLINSGFGHTGVILGIGSDNSVIVGETDVVPVRSNAKGLISQYSVGVKTEGINGSMNIEKWDNVDDFVSYNLHLGYSSMVFAKPADEASVLAKVQAAQPSWGSN